MEQTSQQVASRNVSFNFFVLHFHICFVSGVFYYTFDTKSDKYVKLKLLRLIINF